MFPSEMTQRKQWITWRMQGDSKIPNGKSNDPSTWNHYDEIKDNDKVAFVFSSDDPYVGIDLDDCFDENGDLSEPAQIAFDLFNDKAYIERSFSGKGLHIILKGKKPTWSVCKVGNVECYEDRRFWIMTGNVLGRNDKITDCQPELEEFLSRFLRKKENYESPTQQVSVAVPRPLNVTNLTTLYDRGLKYISNIPSAGQGSRNETGFRLAGNLWAMQDELGGSMSESDIESLMLQWNSRNTPPMPESEVKSLVRSSKVNGTPRAPKPHQTSDTDLDLLAEGNMLVERLWPTKAAQDANEDEDSDVDFCLAMLPEEGIIRKIYDYYYDLAIRPSPIMGLAVAISAVEVLIGRKIATQTDLRSNDYNLIIAQTASGKEACKGAIVKLFTAAGADNLLMAADVQSGNGLITAISNQPCSIWIGDEFGKVLQGILDKKGSQHLKNIGKHLLTLYGESAGKFLGAAHAAGSKNEIDQPHLCILGLSTGSTIFSGISEDQVADGLLNRICFWPVQERPKRKRNYSVPEIDAILLELIKAWVEFDPQAVVSGQTWDPNQDFQVKSSRTSLSDMFPHPIKLMITPDASMRWDDHNNQIDDKMEKESSQRSAMWGRTGARSLMLAMVHRCSRMSHPQESHEASIELQDINWGIRLSNWLSRIACELVEQNMVDKNLTLAKRVLEALSANGPVVARTALKQCRTLTAGDLDAAAIKLGYQVHFAPRPVGRPQKQYLKPKNQG
jgi:hypothetical protein